jgi:hypothetical protein
MKMTLPSLLVALLAVPMMSLFDQSAAVAKSPDLEPPAQLNQDDAQDDQGAPRVARLQSLDRDVSFQRAGDQAWVQAVANMPLLTGDQIYTGERSGALIQLAHGTFIRLSEKTSLAITELSEETAQLEVTSGSATVQLYRLQDVFGRFEIDTPVAAAILLQDGAYRVEVQDNGEIQFATRAGLAEVTTEDATLKVRAGFRLQAGGKGSGKLDVVAIAAFDDWDLTGSPLDTTIDTVGISTDPVTSPSPDYVGSYQDSYSSLYGLDELADCGVWTNVASYGNCWIPRVPSGWAPYRSGRWLWVPALGWTWLPAEPWGWAPYHYGRWSFIPGLGWAWVPGFGPQRIPYGYGYRYYAWRPALVYFFNYSIPGGHYVGWQPLRPGDVWHRPGWYEQHPNPGWRRPVYSASSNGVSVVPVGVFSGSATGRPEAPSLEHGRFIQRFIQGSNRPVLGTPSVSAGLSGIQPGRLAAIPIRPVDGGKQVGIQPPSGVISRPVLTTHLPAGAISTGSDSGLTGATNTQVRRERYLVQPSPAASQNLNIGPEERRRTIEQTNPSGYVRNRIENGTDRGQLNSSQQTHQRHESSRQDSTGYGDPSSRLNQRSERESPRYAGGSSSANSSGSGSVYNSGGGHSQPHTDSHQNGSGSQNSGSSSHNSTSSGSSGQSGSQNSGSSAQGQSSTQSHSSKKN